MTLAIAINIVTIVLAIIGMEIIAILAHKYIMHGIGWAWHKSHHVTSHKRIQKNDLYGLIFAIIAISLIAYDSGHFNSGYWVGIGMTIYGIINFICHDGLVHNRWPLHIVPRRGYLKHLVQAHRLHHAVTSRTGCVSFGFIYAPPIKHLKTQLQSMHDNRLSISTDS